jgi:hypothetical protein
MKIKLLWCDKCNKLVYHYVYIYPEYPYKFKHCQVCKEKSLYSIG